MTSPALTAAASREPQLRQRVALLCHLVRWISAAWIAWALFAILTRWSDRSALADSWGRFLKLDLTNLPALHHALAFGVILVDLAASALVVVFIWRLFGRYLEGHIFDARAVAEMRRLGWAGVAAIVVDILARPLIHVLLSMHAVPGTRAFGLWLQPNDLLHLMMALFIVVLAHIFRTGTEIADDHRQIV